MVLATRFFDALSAVVILITGVYVEIVFSDLFGIPWKLLLGVAVLSYVVLLIHKILVEISVCSETE